MKSFKSILFVLFFIITKTTYAQTLQLDKLTDSIQSILKKENITGAFVTVVSKDSILYKRGIGYADIEQQIPVNSSHLFKIGSISKTFTALAIMKLVEEGKLNLNTKLADIAPEIPFTNKWETTHPIRIKHLLDHKTGFDDTGTSVYAKEMNDNITAFDAILATKISLKSRWEPGLGFAYSNTGCTILGYIIEKITYQRYQDYIKNEILIPLGMDSTDFRSGFPDTLSSDYFAIGYNSKNDAIKKTIDYRLVIEAAGSLLSNADDMSTFLQFLLNKETVKGSTIVTPSSLDLMESLHGDLEIENNITYGYGLGVYMRTYGSKNIPFYGHGGDIPGFSSYYIYNRELDLGITISRNTLGSNKKLLKIIVDYFTGDVERTKNKNNLNGTDLSAWDGEYRLLTSRQKDVDLIDFPTNTIKLVSSTEKLSINRFLKDKSDVYIHKNGNSFKKEKYSVPSLHLIEKEDENYINYKGAIYIPTNSVAFLVFRIILVLSLVFGIVAISLMCFYSIIALFKKTTHTILKRNIIVALPFIFFLLPVVMVYYYASIYDFKTIGEFNVTTLFIFISSVLSPLISIFSAYWFFRNSSSISNKFLKIYYNLVVFGGLFLSVYLIYHGWFMKMMWI